MPPALSLIRQGRLRALAYGARERSPAMPDVPTLAEAGVPYFETGGIFGWLVPSATPRAVVEKIAADAGKVVGAPAFRDKYILGVGLDPLDLGPAQFADLLNQQRATLSKRFVALNLKIE